MTALARGQENTTGHLNWFMTLNGVLTDMWAVEYRIMDITGGLPGAQIYPATVGEYEVVTSGTGNFSTGSYYAYNNTAATGWTPAVTASIGTHRIQWRWKLNATAAWQGGMEDFEIIAVGSGGSTDTYINIVDIRALGITEEMRSDSEVLASIEVWQAFLERACRQWFNPRTMVLEVDGSESDAIHLGVPIVNVTSLHVNNSSTAMDPALYKVYSGTDYPDDRKNPRIKLVGDEAHTLYSRPVDYGHRSIFRKGRQNQTIVGTFGYLESDGSCPKLIKRALTKLVVEKLAVPIFASTSTVDITSHIPPVLGGILEERTDGHQMKYAQAGGEVATRQPGLVGITNDQEILDIIKLYKAPIGIATPAHRGIN